MTWMVRAPQQMRICLPTVLFYLFVFRSSAATCCHWDTHFREHKSPLTFDLVRVCGKDCSSMWLLSIDVNGESTITDTHLLTNSLYHCMSIIVSTSCNAYLPVRICGKDCSSMWPLNVDVVRVCNMETNQKIVSRFNDRRHKLQLTFALVRFCGEGLQHHVVLSVDVNGESATKDAHLLTNSCFELDVFLCFDQVVLHVDTGRRIFEGAQVATHICPCQVL